MTDTIPSPTDSGSLWRGIRNLIVAVLTIAVAAFGLWYFLHGDNFRRANPGDCLDIAVALGPVDSNTKIVDCGSAEARSKVLGMIKDKHWDDFKGGTGLTLCKPWDAKGAIFLHEPDSDIGDVLCLEPLKK